MENRVFDFLASEGVSSLSQIFVRIGSRPQNIVTELVTLAEKKIIKVEGPKSLDDLRSVIDEMRKVNGYDAGDKDYQRRAFVDHISKNLEEFDRTKVDLTFKGARNAYEPFRRRLG